VRTELHHTYVLHRRAYRETSLILECISAEHGRVGLVARGAARGRKRGGESMQAFQKYAVAWSGRSDLHTLTKLEPAGRSLVLAGDRLFSGFYVNELTMRLTTRHDPNPDLFFVYEQTLLSLAASSAAIEPVLRRFEKNLLDACGYGLQLTVDATTGEDIDPAQDYRYALEQGPLRAHGENQGIAVSGHTLLALARNEELLPMQLNEAKRLMRFVLHHYIGDRPLASRSLFRGSSVPPRPEGA
jgi:DNA repair protein RecO (recombination protein O)